MDYSRFVELRRPVWDRFESHVAEARRRGGDLTHEEVEALAVLYRQVLHDHALCRSRFPATSAARRLSRVALAGTHLLSRERSRARGIFYFFTRLFPLTFRRHAGTFGSALGLFLVVAVFGFVLGTLRPAVGSVFLGPEAVDGLERGELWVDSVFSTVPPSAASSAIATNNFSVALTAWVGGAIAGIGSLYILVLNGLMLGVIIGVTLRYGMADRLFEFIAAHGPLELSIIIVSAGAGLILGRGLIAATDLPRARLIADATLDSLVIVGGSLPWLGLLAVVESFVSPAPEFSMTTKVTLGVALLVLFLTVALNPFPRKEGRS